MNLLLPIPVIILILSLLHKNMLASFSAQKSTAAHSKTINYAGSSVQKSTLDHHMAFIPAKSMESVSSCERALSQQELQDAVDTIRSQFCLLFPPASNK